MSYCVNCGVELNSNEKRCPLCSTPVINPNIDEKKSDISPYPNTSELIVERKIKRTTALLITIILFVPLLVCPLCDYLISGNISWSQYVIFGIVLGWVLIVPPILLHHDAVLKSAWLDFFAITAFLYLTNEITTPQIPWFKNLALPIISLIMVAFILVMLLIKFTKIRTITTVALIVFLAGIFAVAIDLLTNLFIGREILVYWSLPVIIVCSALTLILMVISRLTKLKAIIKKRMHI